MKIRCRHCGVVIESNDMLKHGIIEHDLPDAKYIMKKKLELERDLGFPMEIDDLLTEEELRGTFGG